MIEDEWFKSFKKTKILEDKMRIEANKDCDLMGISYQAKGSTPLEWYYFIKGCRMNLKRR